MWETAMMRYKVAGEREYNPAMVETISRRPSVKFTTGNETQCACTIIQFDDLRVTLNIS